MCIQCHAYSPVYAIAVYTIRHIRARVQVENAYTRHIRGIYAAYTRHIRDIYAHAYRWITLHGWALNVRAKMEGFERIVPCGIQDREVYVYALCVCLMCVPYVYALCVCLICMMEGFERIVPCGIQDRVVLFSWWWSLL